MSERKIKFIFKGEEKIVGIFAILKNVKKRFKRNFLYPMKKWIKYLYFTLMMKMITL